MASKQIFTIFGATGAQGGSVAEVFLSDPALKDKWQVRGVTRDTSKAAAQELASQGAEVVSADLSEKSSLVKALEGSHTVFAVTNYWEKMDAKLEIQQGKNLADAAKEAGVKHFIWSTLKDINKVTNGVLPNVLHFDGKAAVDDYIKSIDLPASYFLPGFYMSNISGGMIFRRNPPEDGPYTMAMPCASSAQAPMYDARRDTGKFVRGMVVGLEDGTFKLGGAVLGASRRYALQEAVDTFAKLFPEEGKRAKFLQLPNEEYKGIMLGAGMPDFAAQEVLENMRLLGEFDYYGGDSLDESVKLAGPGLTTLEEHMRGVEAWKELK